MKKVLMVGPSLNFSGGISSFLSGYCEYLGSSKEVDLTYFDTYEVKRKREQFKSSLSFANLSLWLKVWACFVKTVFRTSPEVIVFNTSSYWGFWEKASLMLVSGFFNIRRSVLIVHGAEFSCFYKTTRLKKLVLFFLGFPDAVIFVSKEMKQFFDVKIKEKSEYVQVPVRHPVISGYEYKDEFFNKVREDFDNVFLTVSVLEERKRVLDIIQAFQKMSLPSSCLIVCGKGEQEDEVKMACGEAGNIFFAGEVNDDKKSYFFDISDFFVAFSEEESFGITFIEAMMSRCLLISPRVGVLKDIGKDNENLLQVNKDDLGVSIGTAQQLNKSEYHWIVDNAYLSGLDFGWDKLGCTINKKVLSE